MKISPILFSTPMIQAILDGRKTQTRRLIKPQPEIKTTQTGFRFLNIPGKGPLWENDGDRKCPYGQPGDILWVRETWQNSYACLNYIYKSDCDNPLYNDIKWKSSLFMPKEACRIFLKIKSIRIERLNDTSEADAMAEGIQAFTKDGELHKYGLDGWHWSIQTTGKNDLWMEDKAYKAYAMLWDKINGSGNWNQNPLVWVIEFERTEKPENFIKHKTSKPC